MSVSRLAEKLREAMAQPQPLQLFEVVRRSPLVIEQVEGDELLTEGDDDFVIGASVLGARASLAAGDKVWVVEGKDEWYALEVDTGRAGGGGLRWAESGVRDAEGRVWDPESGYDVDDLVRSGGSAWVCVEQVPAPSGASPLTYGYAGETPRPTRGWLALGTVAADLTGEDPMLEAVSYGGAVPTGAPGVQWGLRVVTGGHFTITLASDPGPNPDTLLFIEDPGTGAVIASDDDTGVGRLSLLTDRLLTPGDYIVRVMGYDESETFPFTLTLSTSDGGTVAGGATNLPPDSDLTHWEKVAGGGGSGGSVIRHGIGPPASGLGNIGDFYIDIADPDHPFLYGPKT